MKKLKYYISNKLYFLQQLQWSTCHYKTRKKNIHSRLNNAGTRNGEMWTIHTKEEMIAKNEMKQVTLIKGRDELEKSAIKRWMNTSFNLSYIKCFAVKNGPDL